VLHWLHSLLPHLPHFGWVFVFIVVFLNNIGIPLPGDTIVLGAGFILGKDAISLWQPMAAGTAACFLGGIWAFWLGRRIGRSPFTKIHWLFITPERMKWGENFFKRHGPKAVFIARFIFLLPPIAANLLAGMAKMPWRTFLFYDFTGSAVYCCSYILIGFFFGKKWKALEAWMGPWMLDWIAAGIVLVVLGFLFRRFIADFFVRIFFKKRTRK